LRKTVHEIKPPLPTRRRFAAAGGGQENPSARE